MNISLYIEENMIHGTHIHVAETRVPLYQFLTNMLNVLKYSLEIKFLQRIYEKWNSKLIKENHSS